MKPPKPRYRRHWRRHFPAAPSSAKRARTSNPRCSTLVPMRNWPSIVDPVDGTRIFASHLPLFGVMAAVTVRGEVVAGVIHDPVCRDWAYAVRGGGAWVEQEDGTRSPLRVADPAPLSGMDGLIGTTFLAEPLRTIVNTNLWGLAPTASLRCAPPKPPTR